MDELNRVIDEMNKEMNIKKEEAILEQLNDLVSRGLLVIEQTSPVLVRDTNFHNTDPYRITIKQSVRLVLKDKEYIEKLETENKKLIEALKEALAYAPLWLHEKRCKEFNWLDKC